MKNDKDWIKDLLGVNQYLEHFKKHRRQGRIFFRGIVCAIKIGDFWNYFWFSFCIIWW
jgi:hypothetical protein